MKKLIKLRTWVFAIGLMLAFAIGNNCYATINGDASGECLNREDHWRGKDYNQHSISQKESASNLMKSVRIKDGAKVLDVGCGDGKITAEIARNSPNGAVVGVDISASMIEFAKSTFSEERHPNLKFGIKDAQNLDYKDEFDMVFSFTTLQWIENHAAFLRGAYQSLKDLGTLAITMPMGLPMTLEQAVNEIVAMREWESYFQDFSTGWNFVDDVNYGELLNAHDFTISRLAIVAQKDIFPSREIFEKFISQWFPYLRPLPENLKTVFLKQVIDRFLELETRFPNEEVHFKIRLLEVVATKQ